MKGLGGLLPGGYWDSAGVLHREFELAKLTGRDEELLAQSQRCETASLVTTVLSRCVLRLGDISPISMDLARQLLVADRQYLLLKLRHATYGDLVHADLFCPWPECGQRISLMFNIDQIPVTEGAGRAQFYTLTLSPEAAGTDQASSKVSFRLPNGADQEALAPLLAENEAQALTLLLARCLQSGPFSQPVTEKVASLSALARLEIEAEMERLAPKIELSLESKCPECGRAFVVPFNLQRFFFGELRLDRDQLYREVHYLAYHYHWSEREIMRMARAKRHKYIEVLSDEIERLNHGG